MNRTVRILLLEKQELIRNGVRAFLQQDPDLLLVGQAETLADALSLVKRLRPHLVLLDMELPDASGVEAPRKILEAIPHVRILALTSHAKDTTVAAAIESGIHGYVLKDVPADELAHAIRAVMNSRSHLDPRTTQPAFRLIRSTAQRDGHSLSLDRLTPQQRFIMPLLAEGMTNKEIAGRLGLSDKTVRNYLTNIFERLGMHRRTEAAAWFIRESYCPDSSSSDKVTAVQSVLLRK